MADEITIKMLETVRGGEGMVSILKINPGTILREGKIYPAKSNKNGAVSGLCDNREWLGIKPGEFRFVVAPDWLLKIHGFCPKCFRETASMGDPIRYPVFIQGSGWLTLEGAKKVLGMI